MTISTDSISVTYSDEKLRILVEEYITQQKTEFTFKGLCSFILYWAMEDRAVADDGNTLHENYQLQQKDMDRVRRIVDAVVLDGRISPVSSDNFRKL